MSGVDKDFITFACIVAFNVLLPTTPVVAMMVTTVLFYFFFMNKENKDG